MKYPHALPCIVLSICVAAPAAWSGAARAADVANVGRPNIVLILADDKYENLEHSAEKTADYLVLLALTAIPPTIAKCSPTDV